MWFRSRAALLAAVLIVGCSEGELGGENSALSRAEVTMKWRSLEPGLSSPRAAAGAAQLDSGGLLVIGGSSGAQTLSSTELYDPSLGAFVSGPALGTARSMPEVVELLDGRVLVIGGLGAGGETLSSCELYDPETDRFVETGPMASPRARHKAALLPDGRVLVTGGAGLLDIEGDPMGTLESTRSSIELYDPTTGTWSPGPEMQIPRVTHAIATLPGGDVLITGGLTWSGGAPSVSTHVELFEFESGTLRETADLPEGRAEHTLTALSDGRILVTGGGAIQLGASFDITALSASAVYDPASGDWSEGAAMSTGRAGHTGLVLEDGRVLVPGGDSGTLLEMTPTDTCEIYDPDADAWTDTAALPVPLVGYVGFVEAEGRVLIAGGTDGSSTSDAALLFEPVEGAR